MDLSSSIDIRARLPLRCILALLSSPSRFPLCRSSNSYTQARASVPLCASKPTAIPFVHALRSRYRNLAGADLYVGFSFTSSSSAAVTLPYSEQRTPRNEAPAAEMEGFGALAVFQAIQNGPLPGPPSAAPTHSPVEAPASNLAACPF